MNASRRSFLRGALAVSAACVVPSLPALAAEYPVLHADGIHDDAGALQALFDGKPVVIDGEVVQHLDGEYFILRGRTLLISRGLEIKRNGIGLKDLVFQATDDFTGEYMLHYASGIDPDVDGLFMFPRKREFYPHPVIEFPQFAAA